MASDGTWLAAATGIACGAAFFGGSRLLKRVFQLYKQDTSHRSLRVVVTGSTRGLGLALASKFIMLGDHVVLCGRNVQRVDEVRQQLTSQPLKASQRVVAVAADVSRSEDCERIAEVAVKELGGIDIWINNAGATQMPKATLAETPADTISSVISTNLLGAIFGCRAAIRVMQKQGSGHVFNMDGTGSRGNATPNSLAYGASKACMPQLSKSLQREIAGSGVGVHTLSPGMVMTDLLLEGNRENRRALQIFNILADNPETVADWLVPRIRAVKGSGEYIRCATVANSELAFSAFDYLGASTRFFMNEWYLTPLSAAWRFATGPWRMGRLVPVP